MLLNDSIKWKCYLVQYNCSLFDVLRGISAGELMTQPRTSLFQSKAATSFSDSLLLAGNMRCNVLREQREPSHVANKSMNDASPQRRSNVLRISVSRYFLKNI